MARDLANAIGAELQKDAYPAYFQQVIAKALYSHRTEFRLTPMDIAEAVKSVDGLKRDEDPDYALRALGYAHTAIYFPNSLHQAFFSLIVPLCEDDEDVEIFDLASGSATVATAALLTEIGRRANGGEQRRLRVTSIDNNEQMLDIGRRILKCLLDDKPERRLPGLTLDTVLGDWRTQEWISRRPALSPGKGKGKRIVVFMYAVPSRPVPSVEKFVKNFLRTCCRLEADRVIVLGRGRGAGKATVYNQIETALQGKGYSTAHRAGPGLWTKDFRGPPESWASQWFRPSLIDLRDELWELFSEEPQPNAYWPMWNRPPDYFINVVRSV